MINLLVMLIRMALIVFVHTVWAIQDLWADWQERRDQRRWDEMYGPELHTTIQTRRY